MTLFAEVNGTRVIVGAIAIPEGGAWGADLVLEKEVELATSAAARVKLAELELVGAVFRAGPYAGRTMLRLIGGKANGWRRELAPKGYSSPAGVKLSTVLSDAAREVGESVRVDTDRVLGPHFVRVRAPAARLLNLLAGEWYVAPDGTTVVGSRASSPIASSFELVSLDRGRGVATVATEFPADFTPGRTFTSSRAPGVTFTISSVTHKFAGSSVRAEVMFR